MLIPFRARLRQFGIVLYRALLHAGFPFRVGESNFRRRGIYQDRMSLNTRHEPWLDEVYRTCLAVRSGVFLDVGVNTGQSLLKLLSFDPERAYIGFEPQVDCAFFVQEFIRLNRLNNHVVLPVGLGDFLSTVKLQMRDDTADSTASHVEGFRPADFYRHQHWVVVASGDDLLENMDVGPVGAIKVDVEGGELDVLRGLTRTLRRDHPLVIFEVLNHFLAITRAQLPQDIREFREERIGALEVLLKGCGYQLYQIRPDNELRLTDRIAPSVSADRRVTDYLAVHADDFGQLSAAWRGKTLH